jgi:hypothetical protein
MTTSTLDPTTRSAEHAFALDPHSGSQFLRDLGFLVTPDIVDPSAPSYLLVALRKHPTMGHFDPELVEYWVNQDGRGVMASISAADHMPLRMDVAWGTIRISDRLGMLNEYLTFGGNLSADRVDGVTVAVFASSAPILRRGGHSQGWDPGAQNLAAFFARLRASVGATRHFESLAAAASPLARYAAFIADAQDRYRSSSTLRGMYGESFASIEHQANLLAAEHPADWRAGVELARGLVAGSE